MKTFGNCNTRISLLCPGTRCIYGFARGRLDPGFFSALCIAASVGRRERSSDKTRCGQRGVHSSQRHWLATSPCGTFAPIGHGHRDGLWSSSGNDDNGGAPSCKVISAGGSLRSAWR